MRVYYNMSRACVVYFFTRPYSSPRLIVRRAPVAKGARVLERAGIRLGRSWGPPCAAVLSNPHGPVTR